ncbi:hypothetical protein [Martelella sp. UBA3392]|uniref:hypothetical protein n=1 Tax=unclassified Martelella TaxID=2629616 RepID=UPI0031F47E9E|tara:strand:+ start:478 stop:1131 length:654 start_codon:yes stop_codon:yes gene_type:complete
MRDGTSYHETRSFDRRPAATAWIRKREKELARPDALEALNAQDLSKTIERYTEEAVKEIGRTKARVLKTAYPIADMPCSAIRSKNTVAFLPSLPGHQSLPGQRQTIGNYASHLASIFAIAHCRLDDGEMGDAITVARRMGIISRSAQRHRRPILEERLLTHFIDRRRRPPQAMPMHKVIVFALFSTRRQAEITRLTWDDFQKQHKRILVRDMKHPGE